MCIRDRYTVMRYLQYSTLQQKKLTHFDCWASTFGETTTAIELAPEGTGYRARTRFAKFFNLPELMSMFKEVADIKTSDQLHLPVPVAKFETCLLYTSRWNSFKWNCGGSKLSLPMLRSPQTFRLR